MPERGGQVGSSGTGYKGRCRGAEGRLAVGTRQHAFEECDGLSGAEDTTFAGAGSDREWSQEAAGEVDGGQPPTQLGECCQRQADIEHSDTEAALNVAEVIAESRLRVEAEKHAARVEVSLEDGKRREVCAHRPWVGREKVSEFFSSVQGSPSFHGRLTEYEFSGTARANARVVSAATRG